MTKEIKPSAAKGTIRIPASKSIVQRAIAAAMLANGTSTIINPSRCDDCLAALDVARQMGATIDEAPEKWAITGGFTASNQPLSCGEAGLSIRMFTPILATLNRPQTLTGHGSLALRPMAGLEEAISQLGAGCITTNGKLPITVKGPMAGGTAKIDGSLSSQVLTGLLMAAPLAASDVRIEVANLKSKPYIDMTLAVMQHAGIKAVNNSYTVFEVKAGQSYQPFTLNAEGDWSGAAFFLVAGAIAGSVCVENISLASNQADKAIVRAIELAGGRIAVDNGRITSEKMPLTAFTFDATDCPDLFPPLAVLAAACTGTSVIKGVSRLIFKESNRAMAIQQELAKAGIAVELNDDYMHIAGGTPQPCSWDSHNDHRMAMAAGILALVATGPIAIANSECISKSYPEFFDHLASITSK